MTTTVVFLTTADTSPWTVPSDWNNASNSVRTIGAGGGGAHSTVAQVGSGGGGGGWSEITNLTLTPLGSVQFQVGVGGPGGVSTGAPNGTTGTDTWFNGASLGASSVGAKGGGGATPSVAGTGGASGNGVGTTKTTGGDGGTANNLGSGGAGGGGAASTNGTGGKGADATTAVNGGGGGGGSGGGTAGTAAPSTTGGDGGNNSGGSGHGTGGTINVAGSAGSNGGGGGGGGQNALGGAGGAGQEYDSTHGSGGGGGGGGGVTVGQNGGAGGNYGAGGGGGGYSQGAGGLGAGGLIIITYESQTAFVVNQTISNLSPSIFGQVIDNVNLSSTISGLTSSATADFGQIHAVVNATIDPITSSALFTVADPIIHALLNALVDPITSSILGSSPRNLALNQALEITPYLRLIPTPYQVVSLDPLHDPIWVAVEVDVFDENDDPLTIRMGNRGTIKRTVDGVLYQYEPRLAQIPLQLGTTINVTQYGSPVRGQPNGGVIQFEVDAAIWQWFQYRWIGQTFRVYEGQSVDPIQTDVDEDLTLVYVGRIASLKHDTLIGTLQTTDESLQWDNPLVTSFYDTSFPAPLQGKPKPFLWGYGFGIEPQIEDEATQKYAVSHRPGGLDFISQVRVGGIPWNFNAAGPPSQGEWTPDLPNGTFVLGSPTLGMDVRCDAQQGVFSVAGLIRWMIEDAGGEVDDDYMGRLDAALLVPISYATSTTPVNRLDAIDDFVTNSGCWWSCGPLAKAIAGVIDVPAAIANTLLDDGSRGRAIKTLDLNTIHPPAWRIRVGYQRNWSPETGFAPSVLQVEQNKWSTSGQVYEPHYENNDILDLEPRAVDVPQLTGTFVAKNDAHVVQQRLVPAWGTVRSLFDVTAYLRPEEITLYDTVAVNYMMVSGLFRITSAIRAVGLGPATLQLWGTIGPFGVEPPIAPVLPAVPSGEDIIDMGIWFRASGSGTFQVGVDCPATVTRLDVQGVGGGGGGAITLTDSGEDHSGGCGGAGGYFEDVLTTTAGSSFAWSVGSGGAGSPPGHEGFASSGGTTSFGPMSAFGGVGGEVDLTTDALNGGFGGSASGATVTMSGGIGNGGFIKLSSSIAVNASSVGGASFFGGGAASQDGSDLSGGAPGSGGGSQLGTVFPGGDGNNGCIVVRWFVT